MTFAKIVNNAAFRKSENVSALMRELNIYLEDKSENVDSEEKRRVIGDLKRWLKSRK